MLQKILKSGTKTPGPFIKKPSPITALVNQNQLLRKDPKFKYSPSYINDKAWYDQPHFTKKALPEKPTDIKGVDSAAYQLMNDKSAIKNFPVLSRNRFFTLRFVDLKNDLSLGRKSNIAYTFTNYAVALLNDPKLGNKFKSYKGAFKNLPFFQTQPQPMGTAVARSKYRKLVKRTLHDALHRLVPNQELDIAKVSGVYLFRFTAVPVTEIDMQEVKSEIEKAIKKLYLNANYSKQSDEATKGPKQTGLRTKLLQHARKENTLDAHKVPGFVPKLPYLFKYP